ncbi:cyclase family protein [Vandammella animalimorsus]|uniref:Cyclase family protein n=1 Tax=Vandammella animalimorsus TaxID=2029117 RepID=A0A3M6R9J3_9BURK|nr:cyclase family protein [Vandammella animalimorsus]RMX11468.1 cyclase family protein [Vandammella animalimorsus]
MSASTALGALRAALQERSVRVIDLTQTLSESFPTLQLPPQFGQVQPFRIERISRYDDNGPGWYWNNFSCGEHTGTHFDAPAHWITGRECEKGTVDSIPVENFIAPAVVVDASAEVAANPDWLLTVEFLEAWEQRHGRIPQGAWVLFRTDWSRKAGDADAFLNMREDGAHTPGPTQEAVEWMIHQRQVHGFGVETINTDAGQSYQWPVAYPCHTLMHGAGRYGLQCLKNLDQLPPQGALILSAPLKIEDGSGSPLRVLALVEA